MQLAFFILQNPFLKNFAAGQIYQGNLKFICSPGLNCYSCPAAAVSCPIGAAQLFFAGARHGISLYITGFLLTAGTVFGRFICAYVCPMGFLQDLSYKIKTPKAKLRLKFLRYLKYAVLIIFVVALPLFLTNELSGLGQPWFCKYICPSGTVFGAVPLLAANDFLRQFAGAQFILKAAIAAAVFITSVFVFRFFCRVLCPLGAVYSLLNKTAVIQMRCDKEKCGSCKNCEKACDIKIKPHSQPNDFECVRCGKCLSVCKNKALGYGVKKTKLRLIPQIAFLMAGILIISQGLISGEHTEILKKAVLVCMECIGIG